MSAIHQDPRLPASTQIEPVQNRTRPDSDGRDGGRPEALTRSAAVVIAVTLQRLVDDATRFWSVEEQLVLDALRRSAKHLNDASIPELSDYVSKLSPEQLRGVASNVKGIYHELLFVHVENLNTDGIEARIFEATNHPGADVEFVVDGDTIREVQLKAVASPAAILEHLSRYPDIEVAVTEEVAASFLDAPNVSPSGFSNGGLTNDVSGVFSELPGDGLGQEIAEGVAMGGLVGAAMAAGKILREGKVSRQQFSQAFGDMAVGGVAATALDVLLDGVS